MFYRMCSETKNIFLKKIFMIEPIYHRVSDYPSKKNVFEELFRFPRMLCLACLKAHFSQANGLRKFFLIKIVQLSVFVIIFGVLSIFHSLSIVDY